MKGAITLPMYACFLSIMVCSFTGRFAFRPSPSTQAIPLQVHTKLARYTLRAGLGKGKRQSSHSTFFIDRENRYTEDNSYYPPPYCQTNISREVGLIPVIAERLLPGPEKLHEDECSRDASIRLKLGERVLFEALIYRVHKGFEA